MRRIRYQEIADELRGPGARRRRPVRCCRARRSCRREFGASRVTVRRALELLRDDGLIDARQGFGWFVAAEPVRQTARAARHDRGRSSRRRHAPRAHGSIEFAFERATGQVRDAARRRPGAAGQAGEPGRRRAVRRRHGVVPGRARPAACRATTSSVARSTSCSTSACAARRRRSAPTSPTPPTPRCSPCPRARRCCGASGSPPTRRPAGAAERARLPGAPHRVRRRAAERPSRRSTPSGLRLVEEPGYHWSQCSTFSSGSRLRRPEVGADRVGDRGTGRPG